jgi:hypothetical protein
MVLLSAKPYKGMAKIRSAGGCSLFLLQWMPEQYSGTLLEWSAGAWNYQK